MAVPRGPAVGTGAEDVDGQRQADGRGVGAEIASLSSACLRSMHQLPLLAPVNDGSGRRQLRVPVQVTVYGCVRKHQDMQGGSGASSPEVRLPAAAAGSIFAAVTATKRAHSKCSTACSAGQLIRLTQHRPPVLATHQHSVGGNGMVKRTRMVASGRHCSESVDEMGWRRRHPIVKRRI